MLHRCRIIYKTRMSPALNGSSAIWHFKGSNVIEIHDGITFDFYTGLPQSLNKRVFFSLVKYALAKLHNLLIECCNTILAIAKVVMGTILAVILNSCNHGQIAMATNTFHIPVSCFSMTCTICPKVRLTWWESLRW